MTTALHPAGMAVKNFPTGKILSTSGTPKIRQLQSIDGESDEAEKAQTSNDWVIVPWVKDESYYSASDPAHHRQQCNPNEANVPRPLLNVCAREDGFRASHSSTLP
jgi:hypothetical protein